MSTKKNPPNQTIRVLKWLAKQRRLPESIFYARLAAFPVVSLDLPTIITYGKKDPKVWDVALEVRPRTEPFFGGQIVTNGWTLPNRKTLQQALAGYEAETGTKLQDTRGLKFAGIVSMPNQVRGHAVVIVFAKAFLQKPRGYRGVVVKVSRALGGLVKLSSERLFLRLAYDCLRGRPPRFVEYLKKL